METIPGVSRVESASTRVLVTRWFMGTRTPRTREYLGDPRTRDESLYFQVPGFIPTETTLQSTHHKLEHLVHLRQEK